MRGQETSRRIDGSGGPSRIARQRIEGTASDGRIGLRLARPGTRKAVPALDYVALGEESQQVEQAEERRIFYVGMTRARERLILTGAAKVDESGAIAPPLMSWACS